MNRLLRHDPLSWPIVYFCHIPKTGGSTLAGWLRKIYPKGSVLPHVLLQQLRDPHPTNLEGFRCYCGHFGTALDPCLPVSARRIVMLRDPVEATLSLFKFITRSDFSRFSFDQKTLEKIRHIQALKGSIEQCLQIEWMRDFFRNPQTRILAAEYQLSNYLHAERSAWLAHIQDVDSAFWAKPGSKLEKALGTLDRMAAVGIFEDFNRSADLLMQRVGLPSPETWPIKNADPARSAQPQKMHADGIPETVLSDLRTLLKEDENLYRHAFVRFHGDLSTRDELPQLQRWHDHTGKPRKMAPFHRAAVAVISWWKSPHRIR